MTPMNAVTFTIVLASAAATFLVPWHEPPFVGSPVDMLLAAGCALIATGILGTLGAKS
jgi:hypothetical protein